MSRIAQLNVNPQIVWRTLGPNQYSSRPLISITIRELLQNSVDAIKASGRDDGEISFQYLKEGNIGNLYCKDNGVGMDEDTLLDKFLVLGESQKPDGAVGGFGIAKAAIIGACDFWNIKTRDNYLDSEMIGKEPIKKMNEYIEGTIIHLQWNLESSNEALTPTLKGILKGVDIIYYSNLENIKVSFIERHKNDLLSDSHFDKYEEKKIYSNNEYDLIQLKYLPKEDDKIPRGYSKVIYRINGLVQFIEELNYITDCFFIVDLKTDKTPEDPLYPLGPSRETIKDKIKKEVNDIIMPFVINPLSSTSSFNEKQNEVKLYHGKTIGEGKNTNIGKKHYSSIPSFRSDKIFEGDGNPIEYEFIVRRVNSNANINIYAENNQKLLIAWARILELGAKVSNIYEKENFGIGFILDDKTIAERYQYSSKIFYLINPKHIPVSKPQEAIPKLIFEAAHELAHSEHSDHTENFTALHSFIFRKMYENFAEIKWIRKFMREGIF